MDDTPPVRALPLAPPVTSSSLDANAVRLARYVMSVADRFDRNQLLSVSEMRAFLGGHPFVEWITDTSRMVLYDSDHDGCISLPELETAAAAWMREHKGITQNRENSTNSPNTHHLPMANAKATTTRDHAEHEADQKQQSVQAAGDAAEAANPSSQQLGAKAKARHITPDFRIAAGEAGGTIQDPGAGWVSEGAESEALGQIPSSDQREELLAEVEKIVQAAVGSEMHDKSLAVAQHTRELETQLKSAKASWSTQWQAAMADKVLLCEEVAFWKQAWFKANGEVLDAKAESSCLHDDLDVACRTILSLQDDEQEKIKGLQPQLELAQEELGAARTELRQRDRQLEDEKTAGMELVQRLEAAEKAKLHAERCIEECERAVQVLRKDSRNALLSEQGHKQRSNELENELAELRTKKSEAESRMESRLVAAEDLVQQVQRQAALAAERHQNEQRGEGDRARKLEQMVGWMTDRADKLAQELSDLQSSVGSRINEAWREAGEAQSVSMELQAELEGELTAANSHIHALEGELQHSQDKFQRIQRKLETLVGARGVSLPEAEPLANDLKAWKHKAEPLCALLVDQVRSLHEQNHELCNILVDAGLQPPRSRNELQLPSLLKRAAALVPLPQHQNTGLDETVGGAQKLAMRTHEQFRALEKLISPHRFES
eukprot:TRINITY_DN12214_c0_g2_i1.p1 TRINITY_DN12214_c0_g2~~TRINITY_DN12214_c0_g2_i1.p1  ORF type:complete len:664 (-),score=176.59 TRINITY_DN12214_c0_g2_i1:292-2283(-)